MVPWQVFPYKYYALLSLPHPFLRFFVWAHSPVSIMNTPICRFSARLREKELAARKPANTQSKERPAQAPSTVSTSRPSSAKRRKTDHEATEQNSSKASSISRPDVRVKGRRGRLKLMTEMPMDVLYEIFNSLEPIDLLHLSWANKSLHSIIMGKSARFLWENVCSSTYVNNLSILEQSYRHLRHYIRPDTHHLNVPPISTSHNTQNYCLTSGAPSVVSP